MFSIRPKRRGHCSACAGSEGALPRLRFGTAAHRASEPGARAPVTIEVQMWRHAADLLGEAAAGASYVPLTGAEAQFVRSLKTEGPRALYSARGPDRVSLRLLCGRRQRKGPCCVAHFMPEHGDAQRRSAIGRRILTVVHPKQSGGHSQYASCIRLFRSLPEERQRAALGRRTVNVDNRSL
jgi:hypothetical protein